MKLRQAVMTIAALGALGAVSACSKDDPTSIDASWVGTYHLQLVDGKAPPQPITPDGSPVVTTFESVTLSFGLTGWNETDTFLDTPQGGTANERVVQSNGTAQRHGNTITFYAADGSVYNATIDGTAMTFDILVSSLPHSYVLVKDQ
jgi:hypothetical protein